MNRLLCDVVARGIARRLASLTQVLGPKTLGRIEVLGKARFLRATLRFSDLALQTMAGLIGLFLSMAGMIGAMVQSTVLRMMRRALQQVTR